MERVRVDDVERFAGPATVKRPLARALGTTDMGLNYYELEPGDSFAFGYHAHENQEEVFYVASGTVTFETEDGPVAVGPDEAVRFGPGEYQRGINEGDERVVALAIGAPADAGETEVLRECDDCGGRRPQRIERDEDGEELVTVCADCGGVTARFGYGER